MGCLAVLLASPRLRGAFGPGRERVAATLLHSASLSFMLAMSAAFHAATYLCGDSAPLTLQLQRLDHLGVWVAMAGFYVLPQLVLQRGLWRWGPLGAVGLGAAVGSAVCMVEFGRLGRTELFAVYALVSVVGCVTTARLIQLRGWRETRWLHGFWLAFAGGAACYVGRPPDLIPGVFGHHELWHVGVLLGVFCHWRFVHQIVPLAEPVLLPELAWTPLRARE